MEGATAVIRFLSIQSPIKVGPSKWEHREKSNGDVALKAYYAGTFHSSILVPYGIMFLPILWIFNLFLCEALTFSQPTFISGKACTFLHPLFWDSLVSLDSIDQTQTNGHTRTHIAVTENRIPVFLSVLRKTVICQYFSAEIQPISNHPGNGYHFFN